MVNWIFKLWDPLAPDLWASPTKICAFGLGEPRAITCQKLKEIFSLPKQFHSQRVTVWCGFSVAGIIGWYFFENKVDQIVTVIGARCYYIITPLEIGWCWCHQYVVSTRWSHLLYSPWGHSITALDIFRSCAILFCWSEMAP